MAQWSSPCCTARSVILRRLSRTAPSWDGLSFKDKRPPFTGSTALAQKLPDCRAPHRCSHAGLQVRPEDIHNLYMTEPVAHVTNIPPLTGGSKAGSPAAEGVQQPHSAAGSSKGQVAGGKGQATEQASGSEQASFGSTMQAGYIY